MPGVEKQHEKMLALLLSELRSDERNDIIGSANLLGLLSAVAALRQLADIHMKILQRGGWIEEGAPAV